MADPSAYAQVLEDLSAEHEDLDALVASLDDGGWEVPTPAPGWAVRDQIGHLAFFDARAREALTDPEGFTAMVAKLQEDPGAQAQWMEDHLIEPRSLTAGELLGWWRAERSSLLPVLAVTEATARIPWFGPPMSAASFATARLMETWAHGQDIADAVGVTRLPTSRLRHVAHLGVRTMGWSFAVRGREAPSEPVYVHLRSPDHEVWAWGPEDAENEIRGTAIDFCLVVTRRRHPADVHLEVEGPVAEEWMTIAQAFAGPPGEGRDPGQFGS
ncbi:MAG TPA: TIGR03084 family metal-binding protein [Acidimicrobiales bacterium]